MEPPLCGRRWRRSRLEVKIQNSLLHWGFCAPFSWRCHQGSWIYIVNYILKIIFSNWLLVVYNTCCIRSFYWLLSLVWIAFLWFFWYIIILSTNNDKFVSSFPAGLPLLFFLSYHSGYSRGSSIVIFNGKNDIDICTAEKNMILNRRNQRQSRQLRNYGSSLGVMW